MKYKLIIFDIDGTITGHISSWRYIHEKLGLWDEIACRYQKRFLAGKISYRDFCELDAAHWKGMREDRIRRVFRKARFSRNAGKCIKKLKARGFKLAAISTGLQYMADRVKKELGFDLVSSNRLIARRGRLTGGVVINISYGGKGLILKKIMKRFSVRPSEVISVGDSRGDIPLFEHSGYSIAFNSSDRKLSRIADYECRTRDFEEVYRKIEEISRGRK